MIRKYKIEIDGKPCINVALNINFDMKYAYEYAQDPQLINNLVKTALEECVIALDGNVTGLIIPDLENI